MKVQKVGSRGYLFTFDEPYKTNLYVIAATNHLFICDTFLGPDPIKDVMKFLDKEKCTSKPVVVFNSHYDYDHIWGNSEFKDSIILAHELCRNVIKDEGEDHLKKYEYHKRGEITLTLPNVVFKEDSSSCYDCVDKVLFVGDNLESPYPYIRILNIETYIETLEEYLTRNAKFIVSGHDDLMKDDQVIKSNLTYLKNLNQNQVDSTKFSKEQRGIHYSNITQLGELKAQAGMKESALEYYNEAAKLLNEAEDSPNVEKLKEQIGKIIEDLLK
jgi:glyoxylase-like metal-dependent hydrolase (beta-lactamase superfamily II)